METLLAHSFDYLSSYEPSKVRKGLRQVEGLLAQICLSKSKSSPDRRRSYLGPEAQPAPKALTDLHNDPAFCEFFKLQNGFQWNGERIPICDVYGLGIPTNLMLSSRHAPRLLPRTPAWPW